MASKRKAVESRSKTHEGIAKRTRLPLTPSLSETAADQISKSSAVADDENSASSAHRFVPNDKHSSSGDRITIVRPHKPSAQFLSSSLEGMNAMRSRLDAFLPQLETSNRNLRADDNMEDVDAKDAGGQHISMELACGVLENNDQAIEPGLRGGEIVMPVTEHGAASCAAGSSAGEDESDTEESGDSDESDESNESSDSSASDEIDSPDHPHDANYQDFTDE